MIPRLIVKNQKTQEEQVYNLPQDTITIGRTGACDVELADKSISRKHAELVKDGEDFFLIDLKSGNGTYLNGKRIRSIEKHLLRSSDLIKIENYEISFLLLEEGLNKPIEEDTDTDIIEIKMIKKVLRALDKDSAPSLEVLNGSAEGKKIFFGDEQAEVDIGRDPNCSLQIDEAVISRRHAKLMKKWGGVVLMDLNSRNGCFVNNEKIAEKLLRDGDRVLLGTIKLLYRNPQDINIDAISEDISRKKREAALRESEMMEIAKQKKEEAQAAKIREEEEKVQEFEKQEQAAKEAEEQNQKNLAAAEQAPAQLVKPEAPQASPLQNPGTNSKSSGFSLTEKLLIGLGVLVLLFALIGITSILFK